MNLDGKNVKGKVTSILTDQVVFILLLLTLFTLPMPIKYNTWPTVLLYVVVLVRSGLSVFYPLRRNALLMSIGVYFFLALVYAAILETPARFGSLVERRVSILMLPLVIATLNLDRKQISRLLLVYVAAVLSACAISLIRVDFNGGDLYEFSYALIEASIIEPNYLSLFGCFALLILYDLLTHRKLPWLQRAAIVVLMFVFMAYIGFVGSRMPLLVVLCIVAIHGLRRAVIKRERLPLLAFTIIALTGMVMILFIPALYQRVEVLFRLGLEGDWRYYEFSSAWKVWKEKPILGHGFTAAEAAMVAEYEKIGWPEGQSFRFNAHNQVLQSLIEQGIVGLGILLLLYATALIRAIRTKAFLPISFVCYFIACSLTESLLFRNKGLAMFGFFVGILLFNHWYQEKITQRPGA